MDLPISIDQMIWPRDKMYGLARFFAVNHAKSCKTCILSTKLLMIFLKLCVSPYSYFLCAVEPRNSTQILHHFVSYFFDKIGPFFESAVLWDFFPFAIPYYEEILYKKDNKKKKNKKYIRQNLHPEQEIKTIFKMGFGSKPKVNKKVGWSFQLTRKGNKLCQL